MAVHDLFESTNAVSMILQDQSAKIKHLPNIIYRIFIDDKGGVHFLKEHKRYNVPKKVYGTKHNFLKEEILKQYIEKTVSTLGVILHGLKGTGKTLLAEDLSNAFLDMGLPVIRITQFIPYAILKDVISSAGPCIVYIDEFVKIYDEVEKQNSVLPIFSEASFEKVLFVVTENKLDDLSEFFVDRPGRFMYRIKFNGLDLEFVEDYCKAHGEAILPEILKEIYDYVTTVETSMDVLKTLVEKALISKTVEEFKKYYDILNVPAKSYRILSHDYISMGYGYEFGSVLRGEKVISIAFDSNRKKVPAFKKDETTNEEKHIFTVEDIVVTTKRSCKDRYGKRIDFINCSGGSNVTIKEINSPIKPPEDYLIASSIKTEVNYTLSDTVTKNLNNPEWIKGMGLGSKEQVISIINEITRGNLVTSETK